jgi:hypothetical protein
VKPEGKKWIQRWTTMDKVMTLAADSGLREAVRRHAGDTYEAVNRRLDQVGVPHGINETFLEAILDQMNDPGRPHSAIHWLTLARLTEAAILCAGHYADNCEFRAAGDLLVNPRKVHVQVPGRGPAFIKNRHGRLTEQLADRFSGAIDKREVQCRIVAPALLPDLYRRLVTSGYFTQAYLDHVQQRLTAIAATIAFLAAWSVDANERLYQKLQSADAAQRQFVEEHLCRFDATWFWLLGHRIRQAQSPKALAPGAREEITPLVDLEEIQLLAQRN